MRSLQDWMKYLEEQEQSLQDVADGDGSRGRPTPDEPEQTEQVAQPTKIEPPPAPKPDAARPVEPASVQAAAPPRKKPAPRRPTVDAGRREVAQKSYKPFKETREELLQRLLDPMITLEEAARILDVCPTTVRRYTNRGMLKHLRTAGNQRRFRLSDVLAFLEASGREIAD